MDTNGKPWDKAKDRTAAFVVVGTLLGLIVGWILLGAAASNRWGDWAWFATFVIGCWWAMTFRWALLRRGFPDIFEHPAITG